jgi:hypothetical protein
MPTERPPAPTEPSKDRKAEREAKLAQALRANLRRRKADPAQRAAARPKDGDSA